MRSGLLWTAMTALLGFAGATFAAPASSPVLGGGRGLDHMGVAVRDLPGAVADFRHLGFNVENGGRFPGGLSNAIAYFGDHAYLEILAVDKNYGKENADVANFAKKHEGAMFLGLNVSSAKETASYLHAHGFDAMGPEPGSIMSGNETKPPPPMWYDVYTPDKPAKGKQVFTLPIFFIQYMPQRERYKAHVRAASSQPSTVFAVRAVWFAVSDLGADLKSLDHGGFAPPTGDVALLGLRGRSISAGHGSLNLLQSGGAIGPVGAHEDGIVAISFAVKDLKTARSIAQSATKLALPIYPGTYGQSFLIPAAAAHGVAIEMVQG
jgi:hypothetical protein